MKHLKADLHVHTCLSPCAELDMSPKAVVEKSLEKHLDIIAVCDHHSAENVEASIRAAARFDLRVLAGMEINSVEEVHTLAIFETPDLEEIRLALAGESGRCVEGWIA